MMRPGRRERVWRRLGSGDQNAQQALAARQKKKRDSGCQRGQSVCVSIRADLRPGMPMKRRFDAGHGWCTGGGGVEGGPGGS